MNRGQSLEELEVYKIAMEIGEIAWSIVSKWDSFSKINLGGQLVRAADSIALNLSEGFGRFHFKENRNFCYYSRGSAKETLTAIRKARTRNLILEEEFALIESKTLSYLRMINKYIIKIGTTKSQEEHNEREKPLSG